MKPIRYLLFLCILLCATQIALAQTTANLTGTVSLDGNPLPGVTVTATSPNLQGTRTDVTDVNGNYNFGGLPPGEYTVRFDMESMQSVSRTTRVGVAQTGRVDAEMRLSSVAEAITVTATAPAVLETTEVQTNVQAKLVEDLPMGRRLQDAVLLAPGVTNNGPNAGTSITIQGAPAYDNVFMVNGAVINENLRGQAHSLFIEDAIQETTVIVGAVSAEFGRFTGGVVNAITKSGGNEFHGSLRDSITNESWTDVNTAFYEVTGEEAPERPDEMNQIFEGTLGGRIIRDRLWFFLAGRYQNQSLSTPLALSPRAGSDLGPNYTAVTKNERLEGKLTGQITPRHTLVGSYLDVKAPQTNFCPFGCFDFMSLDLARELPNSFMSIHYNGIITDSFLLEGNYSEKRYAFVGSGGDFSDFANGTAWYDINTALFFGAPLFCGSCGDERRDNDLWTAKATYYLASKALGTHTLVAGAEDWVENRLSNNFQSGSNFIMLTAGATPVCRGGVCYPEVHEGDIILYAPINALSQGSNFNTFSAFLNDKWELNRHWSFNLGVRYDKNNGKDSSGATVSKDSNISPRLGAIWDVAGNGRFRVNASYSKYVSRIPESIGGSGTGAGVPGTIYYEYRGPALNLNHTLTTPQVAQRVYDWFQSVGGVNNRDLIVRAVLPGLNTIIDQDLKSPNVDEYTIGAGFQVSSDAFLRLDYVHRDWADFYATFRNQELGVVTDQFGGRYDLGAIRNTNDFERVYDGLTLQAAYRVTQRLNVGGNYTWSELKGNVVAETGGSGPVPEARFSYPEYRNFPQSAPTGFLVSDQTHKVRLFASYDQPTPIGRFNVSVLQRFDSGTPYSAIGTVDSRYNATFCPSCPNPANTSYVTDPTNVAYFFSERGEYRWDDVSATDLALNYELPITKVALFVQVEALNVFNEQAQIGGDTTILTHRQPECIQTVGPDAGRRCARFDPFTQTPQLGVHWQYGPNFGDPLAATTGGGAVPGGALGSYQLPRTYRLSFGLRF